MPLNKETKPKNWYLFSYVILCWPIILHACLYITETNWLIDNWSYEIMTITVSSIDLLFCSEILSISLETYSTHFIWSIVNMQNPLVIYSVQVYKWSIYYVHLDYSVP